MGMRCERCGEEVKIVKIGDNNWSAGCECWTSYSLTPNVALTLYVVEMRHLNGKQWARSIGFSGDQIDNTQLVGPADC